MARLESAPFGGAATCPRVMRRWVRRSPAARGEDHGEAGADGGLAPVAGLTQKC